MRESERRKCKVDWRRRRAGGTCQAEGHRLRSFCLVQWCCCSSHTCSSGSPPSAPSLALSEGLLPFAGTTRHFRGLAIPALCCTASSGQQKTSFVCVSTGFARPLTLAALVMERSYYRMDTKISGRSMCCTSYAVLRML